MNIYYTYRGIKWRMPPHLPYSKYSRAVDRYLIKRAIKNWLAEHVLPPFLIAFALFIAVVVVMMSI